MTKNEPRGSVFVRKNPEAFLHFAFITVMLGNAMVAMNPAQEHMLEVLRGNRESRPELPNDLRHQLRAELDELLGDIDEEIYVTKHKINEVLMCEKRYSTEDVFAWNPNNARGTISHLAIELSSHNAAPKTPMDLVDQAMERACERPETKSIAEYLREMNDAERADLHSQATDRVTKFVETFPRIPSVWLPHAEASTAAPVGKFVMMRGKIDYKIGAPDGNKSGAVLIDFKTGAPWRSHLDDLRFYALVETLRLGTAPFKWINVYIDSAQTQEEVVSVETLRATVRRVAGAVKKIADLSSGRKPDLSPGMGCRFCRALPSCPEGQAHETSLVNSS